ncbi:hypothetical protein AOQ84DRAFT_421140, partial [Glonium stellatum]
PFPVYLRSFSSKFYPIYPSSHYCNSLKHLAPAMPSPHQVSILFLWASTQLVSPAIDSNPYHVSVLIPDSQSFDPKTLLTFHTALTTSVLARHGRTLRHLDISLWTLTSSVAHALAQLPAIRAMSIRMEDPHARSTPRHRRVAQIVAERAAWELLVTEAAWAPRLAALRIEGGELGTGQLATLLGRTRGLRELWVVKCGMVGDEWEGRAGLRVLGVLRCGMRLDEEGLDCLDGLDGLEFLTLQGCHGITNAAVEEKNRRVWRIPDLILPQPQARRTGVPLTIEVDPAYATNGS